MSEEWQSDSSEATETPTAVGAWTRRGSPSAILRFGTPTDLTMVVSRLSESTRVRLVMDVEFGRGRTEGALMMRARSRASVLTLNQCDLRSRLVWRSPQRGDGVFGPLVDRTAPPIARGDDIHIGQSPLKR
jgi:hypothetical protein